MTVLADAELPLPLPLPRHSMLERAIEYVNPELAARRYQARVSLGLAGQYIGARVNRRATEGWRPTARSGNADTLPDLGMLRSRSRDLERNDPIAKGAIDSNGTAILGTGLTPYPRLDAALLGLSDTQADEAENMLLRLWRAHAETPAMDFAGVSDIHEQAEQVLWGKLVNGDILVVRRFVDRPDRMFGLALQLVEADRVCSPRFLDTPTCMSGVEFDPLSAEPIAYHVASRNPHDMPQFAGPTTWSTVARYDSSRIEQAMLVMSRRRPGLLRGVPLLAAVIEPLKQLGVYSDAELTAAVISSFFTVFVKTKTQPGAEGIPVFSPDALGGTTRAQPRSSNADLKLGQGLITELDEDEDITIANPSRPNPQFDPFWLATIRRVGMAIEMPYEVLIKHFSSSFSASRGALIEAWRVYLTRRARLIRRFYQPTWHAFVTEAVARGYINAPGFFDSPLIRAAWCHCEWSGPTMPQVDEVKAANAMRERVALTVTSLEEERASLNGGSWQRNFGQITKERRMLADAGIAAPQPTAGPASTPTDAPDNASTSDQERES